MAAIQTTQVTSAASAGAASAVAADLEAIFGGSQQGFIASGEAQGQGAEGHNGFANQLAAALSSHGAQANEQQAQQFNLQNPQAQAQLDSAEGQNLPFDPSFKSAIEASFAALVQLIQSNQNVETAQTLQVEAAEGQALATEAQISAQPGLDPAQAAALLAQSQLAMATQAVQPSQGAEIKVDGSASAANGQPVEVKLQAVSNPTQALAQAMASEAKPMESQPSQSVPSQPAGIQLAMNQPANTMENPGQVQQQVQAQTQQQVLEQPQSQPLARQEASQQVAQQTMQQSMQAEPATSLPTEEKNSEAMAAAQRSLADQAAQKLPSNSTAQPLNQAVENKNPINGPQVLVSQAVLTDEASAQSPRLAQAQEASLAAQVTAQTTAQATAQARGALLATASSSAEGASVSQAADALPQAIKPVDDSSGTSKFSADSQTSHQTAIRAEMLIAAAERAAESAQSSSAKLSADSSSAAPQTQTIANNGLASTSLNMAAQAAQSSTSVNEVSKGQGLNQAEILSRAEARLEASRASLGSGPLNVEILRMTRQGGGRAVLEVTPPNQGPIRLDLQLDGAGKALLVIDGLTDSMRARLESTAGFLRQDMASLGLTLNLEMREGSAQSSNSEWAQGFGQQSGQGSRPGLAASRTKTLEDSVVSEAVKPAASGSIQDTQSVNLYA